MNTLARPANHRQRGALKVLPTVLIAVAAISAGAFFATQRQTPEQKREEQIAALQQALDNALYLPEDFKQIPDFSLIDQNGDPADQSLFSDRWSLLFFGFTQCPDVCPTTLSVTSKVLKTLESDHADLPQPQVVFISVDPKRDQPENLKAYSEFFIPDIKALTTDNMANMYAVTKPLNIVVSYIGEKDNPEQYTIDHTASIFLVDPELRLRGKFSAPHQATSMVSDYSILLKNLL